MKLFLSTELWQCTATWPGEQDSPDLLGHMPREGTVWRDAPQAVKEHEDFVRVTA